MNNYLAKPVRAQTLKSLLESYLSKGPEEKAVSDLDGKAKEMAGEALGEAEKSKSVGVNGKGNGEEAPTPTSASAPITMLPDRTADPAAAHDEPDDDKKGKTSRPTSLRINTTQRWYPHEQNQKQGQEQPQDIRNGAVPAGDHGKLGP